MQKDLVFLKGNKYCYACNNSVMLTDPYGSLPPLLWPLFIIAIIINTSCGGGAGEGEYCGYISVTSTDKGCTVEHKCKSGTACVKTNKTNEIGNTECECKAIT